jgi:hypothetical protein
MNRSVVKPINTLSGSDFSRKIINKYQTGKIKTLRFPIIIFYKNKEYFFHKRIDMSILLQMLFYNQNILLPLIVKTIPAMKEMLSQLDAGKNTLQSVLKPKNIQNVSNIKNFFTSNAAFNQQTTHIIHSNSIMVNPQISYEDKIKILNFQAFRTEINCPKYRSPIAIEHFTSVNKEATRKYQSKLSAILLLNNLFFNSTMFEINKLLFKEPNQVTAYGPFIKKYYDSLRHGSSSVSIPDYTHKYKLQNLPHDQQILHQIVDLFGNQSTSLVHRIHAYRKTYSGNQTKSSAILPHANLFFNSITLGTNKLFYKYLNQVTVNEPLIKNDNDGFKHTSSSSAQRTYAYKTESGIMRFQDSGYLEQEIEQIKKIVLQTKESISEKPMPSLGEAEIKRYLDINRISDQVYQNIERTIRMERERRGI